MRAGALGGLRTVVFALVLAVPLSAVAQLPLDDDRVESYELGNRTIAEFFEIFLRDQGLALEVSDAVSQETRTLRGERSGTPREIFRSLLDTNQLVAYFDGRTMHVYKENEVGRRFLAVPEGKMRSAKQAIQEIEGTGNVNSVTIVESGLLRVTGVPQFLEEAAQLAGAFMQRTGDDEELVFRFFGLDNAWAADRSFTAGNRTVTIPGVATVLRRLISGQAAGGSMRRMTPRSRQAESLRGQGLASIGGDEGEDVKETLAQLGENAGESGDTGGDDAGMAAAAAAAGDGPTIVAAPGGNGVIVKDVRERMPMYAQLIDRLDERRKVVEVQATIININIDRLQQLGVDFRASGEDGDRELLFGEAGTKQNFVNTLAGGNIAALGQLPGFQLGAILDDDRSLIARVNALADEGAARIVSRPTVVTLNGLEAIVESSEQVFVPVAGSFSADLFDVFAGTILRVTPQASGAGDNARIRMFIEVNDGEITTPLVEGSESGQRQPRVTRNSVTTQARIRNGQSLLLEGLIEEQAEQETTKVPLLGDIPVLGALFRNRSSSQQRLERLFLIEPRVVDPRNLGRDAGEQLPSTSESALEEFESSSVLEPRSGDEVVEWSEEKSKPEKADARDIPPQLKLAP